MYEFSYNGGVAAPGNLLPYLQPRDEEQRRQVMGVKFLLFLIINGQEIPLYRAQRDGLVHPHHTEGSYDPGEQRFATNHRHIKIFVGEQSPPPRKFSRFYSFFVELQQGKSQTLTILPFPDGQRSCLFYRFKAKGRFLTKNQAMGILAPDSDSRAYLKRQPLLPVDTLQKMVKIDREELRADVRAIRMKKQKPE